MYNRLRTIVSITFMLVSAGYLLGKSSLQAQESHTEKLSSQGEKLPKKLSLNPRSKFLVPDNPKFTSELNAYVTGEADEGISGVAVHFAIVEGTGFLE